MPYLRYYYQKGVLEAGCDEAGRGCLAGPVFAGAVILPHGKRIRGLNDSKQLTHMDRDKLRQRIERVALSWAVAEVSPQEIDRINILNASFRAMHLAISQLTTRPHLLLIDGNRFHPYDGIEHVCLVQGDARYAAIAAASILAKTYRDAYMRGLHSKYPMYGWENNVGYPTTEHRTALQKTGPTIHHRRSFRLLPDTQPSLFDEVH